MKQFLSSFFTCDVVAKYPGCDDVPAGREEPLQIRLGHVLREAAHIEVGALDGLAAGAGVGYLERKIKSDKILENLYFGFITLMVLFCSLSPLSVCMALLASSALW